jgi:hypothetical protein
LNLIILIPQQSIDYNLHNFCFLPFLRCRCKLLYLPTNPARRAAALASGKSIPEVLTSSFLLMRLKEAHLPSMVRYFMDWLGECRNAVAGDPTVSKITPSPMNATVHQWCTTDGGVAIPCREPFAMDLVNAVLRGYGFRHLGTPNLPHVDILACAGQFEYRVDNCVVDDEVVPHVCAVPPQDPHEHSGQCCRSVHIPYTGNGRRLDLYLGRVTAQEEQDSQPYVSLFVAKYLPFHFCFVMKNLMKKLFANFCFNCASALLPLFQPYSTNDRKRIYAHFRPELHAQYFPNNVGHQFGPGGVPAPPANNANNANNNANNGPAAGGVLFAPHPAFLGRLGRGGGGGGPNRGISGGTRNNHGGGGGGARR